MNNHSIFSFNRFKLLTIRQLSINIRTMLIATAAIFCLLMVIGAIRIWDHSIDMTSLMEIIMPFIFIGGCMVTSVIFSELNAPHKGYLYLTLPATALEKIASAWFISGILYFIFSVILMMIINLLLIILAAAFTQNSVEVIDLFTLNTLKTFGTYLITQSLFFVGAIHFRKVHFLKTVLALFIVGMIIGIYTATMGKIFLEDIMFNMQNSSDNYSFSYNAVNFNEVRLNSETIPIFTPFMKYLSAIAIVPFMLTVSWFKLKEREV